MPYKERTNFKRYWTIGEIAEDMNVNKSRIRFYEDYLGITNNRGKKIAYRGFERRYTRSQYNDMILLLALMKSKRYTMYGAMQNLKEYKEYKVNG